ncbi:HK97-gp10 family putative phage morphogenesis protein [Tateyamaria sp. SN3-11]|uniref:HK97-gp10 family putative phage morphogenesis protein n=1 Tax=Tateyamaria sp. SN3-11 TaxID=3092147 RepID=UPI0039E9D41E
MSLNAQSLRLQKQLKAIPPEIVEQLEPALIKGAEEVADTMRLLVPVKEGDLKASITVTPPGQTTPAYAVGGGKRTAQTNQALVTIGNEDVRTGHMVEFGTVKSAAQPFMRPAERLAKPKALRRISRAIGKAIRNVVGGPK